MNIEYINNVKPGDIIITSIGSAVLLRQTRAKWYYLYKERVNSISKSEFWRMVDLGEMKISYSETKKYRRAQKKFRVFDLRKKTFVTQQIEEFLHVLSYPDEFWLVTNDDYSNYHPGFPDCLNYLKSGGYECEMDKKSLGFLYIKVTKNP